LRSEKTPRRGSLPGKGNALSGAQPSPPPQRFVRRFGGGPRPRLGGRLRGQRAEVPQAQPSSSPAGQRWLDSPASGASSSSAGQRRSTRQRPRQGQLWGGVRSQRAEVPKARGKLSQGQLWGGVRSQRAEVPQARGKLSRGGCGRALQRSSLADTRRDAFALGEQSKALRTCWK